METSDLLIKVETGEQLDISLGSIHKKIGNRGNFGKIWQKERLWIFSW